MHLNIVIQKDSSNRAAESLGKMADSDSDSENFMYYDFNSWLSNVLVLLLVKTMRKLKKNKAKMLLFWFNSVLRVFFSIYRQTNTNKISIENERRKQNFYYFGYVYLKKCKVLQFFMLFGAFQSRKISMERKKIKI